MTRRPFPFPHLSLGEIAWHEALIKRAFKGLLTPHEQQLVAYYESRRYRVPEIVREESA